jgi:predicted 3-demethylubiquinone-9 3-methyltransferase (glyoxalase superfamily)
MVHYGPGEQCPEGCVKMALFSLLGSQYRCMDSPAVHDFSFTPAISLLAQCDAVEEVDRLFKALSLGGQVLMPLQAYPFSERYAWVNDRFGVSWQLYLIPTAR